MKYHLPWSLAGLAGLLLLTGCAPDGSKAFHDLTFDQALAEAKKQNKVVMIDFGATWCGPCRMLESDTFSKAEVQQFLRDHAIAIKVDIDNNPAVAGKFVEQGIPLMVFLNANGEELGRIEGFVNAAVFLSEAGAFVKKK